MSHRRRNKGGNKGKNNAIKKQVKTMPVVAKEKIEIETAVEKPKVTNGLKTLIVFDTNVLRDMLGKEVVYNSFTFGYTYNELNAFIIDNGLEEFVTLSVSTMVIEELKNQKKRAYKQDVADLKEIVKRLEGLPHIPENSIPIPDEDFDCGTFIEQNATTYIAENNINTLVYKDEHASSILKNMVQKVVSSDKPKSPFAISGPYKDAGFKDGIIWETLMHFDSVLEYDKIIFLSKDGDYKVNCLDDFKEKWNMHIKIEKDKNNVIAELKKDYGNYIEERSIHDFAQTDYFRDYLFDGIKVKTDIVANDVNYKIQNFEIEDICKLVERIPPTDDELNESIVISSTVKILFTEKGKKKEQVVIAKTTLADEESKEIIETTFDIELL
jgi:copper chaperone CopZ